MVAVAVVVVAVAVEAPVTVVVTVVVVAAAAAAVQSTLLVPLLRPYDDGPSSCQYLYQPQSQCNFKNELCSSE